jgi:hypothetical protein
MRVDPLSATDLADIAGACAPVGRSTPLWYHILADAKATADGRHLGPVGGRIVAETLIGLLRADPAATSASLRDSAPSSRPTSRWGPHRTPTSRQPRLHARSFPVLRRRCHAGHVPLLLREQTPRRPLVC